MLPLRRSLLTLVALASVALVACGDDDDEPERAVTLRAGEPLRVAGDEYAFDPPRVVVEGAAARQPLEITLDNRGALAHNLKLFDGGRDLGGTPTFQGGRSESATVELEPGEYRMVCTVGNHEELGMVGTLEIKPRQQP